MNARVKPSAGAPVETKPVRCAIYTRKSSEEGLEQSFNSLDAQREACEAYVKSQAHEGWQALPAFYDDGGFSGGSIERPALKRLLADLAAGKIDVVCVYKIDRLTRSLTDFSRIVDVFDKAGASFVSITQAFNTTTSMGRLTLNVLLSFAQFEREVTGERIRDKIAQSKAKGMWMGGNVLLGYDLKDRELVINPVEAETLREIFQRYLNTGSVHALARELERDGIRSKTWTSLRGNRLGGQIFSRGALYHMLRNPHYLGQIVHKGAIHPGQHPAIIDRALFDQVQTGLDQNRRRGPAPKCTAMASASALPCLTTRLFDADGDPMSPTSARGRRGRTYHYYVSSPLQAGVGSPSGQSAAPRRIPCAKFDSFVLRTVQRLIGSTAPWVALSPGLVRIDVRPDTIEIVLASSVFGGQHLELALTALRRRLEEREQAVVDPGAAHHIRISLPRTAHFRGGQAGTLAREPAAQHHRNEALISALRFAHSHLAQLQISPLQGQEGCGTGQAPKTVHHRNLCRLGFLAPDLQLAILDGRHGPHFTVGLFTRAEIPLDWAAQRRWWRAQN
jgi:site-specific DNA recombinase